MYAADDAYASLRLFEALERKRLALRPVPERPGTVAKVYRLPTVLKGELERVVWMPAAAAAAAGPLGRSTVVGPVREAVGAGFDRAEGTIGLSTQDAAP